MVFQFHYGKHLIGFFGDFIILNFCVSFFRFLCLNKCTFSTIRMLISYWNYSFKLIGIVVTSTFFSKITIYQEEKKWKYLREQLIFNVSFAN